MNGTASAYCATARLIADQFGQLDRHQDLDERAAFQRPPSELLEAAFAQIQELDELLSTAPPPDRTHTRRIVAACANAANYLAFLAHHYRTAS